MKVTTTLIFSAFLSCSYAQKLLPYQNSSLSAEERAADLVARLTLEEKAKLMMDTSPSIARLGIPRFHWWNEALHGVARNGYATVFPITMNMASSFDDALLYQIFCAVSDEARAKNQEARKLRENERYQGLSFWTPNINIFRDPRWGRGQETYGEDPYLTTRMGLAVVNGLQGQSFNGKPLNNKYMKALACAKHFAVHSGPEWNRHSFNIEDLPTRDLWETYLPAFKALVQEGNVAEVMCAYQRVDGAPCCSNAKLERQILRNEWGFKGLITSDCGAIADFVTKGHHETAKTPAEATAQAIGTGTDLECGSIYKSLPEAIRVGLISEEKVNTSLKRLLTARFRLGDFDKEEDVSWTQISQDVIANKEHKDLALKMAEEGIVLLQNRNSILPLDKSQKIVVLGPNANDSIMQKGNYTGTPTSTITILQGIQDIMGHNVKYIPACTITQTLSTEEQILSEVGDAPIAIFVGGISPKLEGEEKTNVHEPGFKGGDRTDLELPLVQRRIIEKLHKAGKKVIFVNCSGGAMSLVPETKNAEAILQAWYPGERGGEAVANILFGKTNPSGKLPVTFYKNVNDLPNFLDYSMKNRTYRYFKGEALFPFGYGLSYTSFEYGKPKFSANKNSENGRLMFTLHNNGKREGTEVVQIYIKRLADIVGPIKSLKAFKRINLKAGEKKIIGIDLDRKSFEGWDATTNTMRVVPGKYRIFVGGSSKNANLKQIDTTIK